jgi:LuxR family maltose regulon positive regulatory protein
MERVGESQFEQALAAFALTEQCQAKLVWPQALTVLTREFAIQAQLRRGDDEAARAALTEFLTDDAQWGEFQVATAAVLVADGDAQAAVDLLAPVLAGRTPVLLESTLVSATLLDAAARALLGEAGAAEADIERALDLAEPDAHLFPFVMSPVRELLERHPRHRTSHASLLSDILDMLAGSTLPAAQVGENPPLSEELSPSELRVLRYLPGNLSASEIASELYLSTSTVKTHMLHIYTKLEVHRRTEAVERARALGLLVPHGAHR